ncbi:hypothetical protein CYLTODRAFT_97509 [Cylindrobasidium torrendii FP15055 ss-10]|uniref:Uncharacterized protein n=1 Tax=Cylindrobasidium torrendii FP15055 ss-10 TaxID=1314674 RepID=A0A0D7BQB6_9AGAR|nr:hypothetical protein CYLTODRAFT_97509 [Cylindrobasidium torrendii FP15055 ss-10]
MLSTAIMTPPRPAFLEDRASAKSRSSLASLGSKARRGVLFPLTAFSNKSSKAKATTTEPIATLPTGPTSVALAQPIATTQPVPPPPRISSSEKPTSALPSSPRTPTGLRPSPSQKILKRVSSVFTKTQAPTDQPAVVSNARRVAALRQAGLLPNKDLSQLELEQDALIAPKQPQPLDEESEAARIKQDWEARNCGTLVVSQGPAEDRMATFKFGGAPSASTTTNIPSAPEDVSSTQPASAVPRRVIPPPLKLHPATPGSSLSHIAPYPHPSSDAILPLSPTASTEALSPLAEHPSDDAHGSSESLSADLADSCQWPKGRDRAATLTSQLSTSDCAPSSVYASSYTLTVNTSESTGSLNKTKSPKAWATEFPHDITAIKEVQEGQGTPELEEENPTKFIEHDLAPIALPVPRRRQTEGGDKSERRRSALFNLKRSVVGSLYRSSSKSSPQPAIKRAPSTRVPISPTMHNHITIVQQASGIQDEETRRMTELAYL